MLSVSRIQSYLSVSGDADYLGQLEAGVAADLEAIVGRYLGLPKAFEDVFDIARLVGGLAPNLDRKLQSVRLSQPVALDACTVFERSAPVDSWVEVDPETSDAPPLPVFEMNGRRLYRLVGQWPSGRRTVRVVYDFGYEVDAAPAGFLGVGLDLVAHRYSPVSMRKIGGRVSAATVRGANITMGSSGGSIPDGLRARAMALRDGGSF